jgi:non-ribosomal peptide synthetase component F
VRGVGIVKMDNALDSVDHDRLLIGKIFVDRVHMRPEAPALIIGSTAVTFAQLNIRVNRISALLRARGVGPDDVVGVYLPRGVDLAAAFLAALRRGVAFLPLNLADPPARIAEMLDGAGARLVMSDRSHAGRVPPAASVLTVDSPADSQATPEESLVRTADDLSLAYVVYTSGSTGRPKPVAVSRGSLCRQVESIIDRYRLTSADRVLQFANPAFDVTIEEILPTLVVGGCVVVMPDSVMAPLDLQRLMAETGVTVANLPTSYWRQWVSEMPLVDLLPGSLRLVVIGTWH